MSLKIVHPRYFCWTSWLHQKFPWSFLLYFFVFFLLCSYWLHLYLFFDFLKERRLKKLFAPISHGSMQIRNLHLTLHSFLLRKVLGSSLESSSQVYRFTHQKKDKTPPKSLPLISFSWLHQTESPAARRKLLSTLSSSLLLILFTSHTFGSNH